jgi:L-aminopeptidase/D-esterase-like protein
MGEAAASAATDEAVVEGCVGAGTGATVGKLFGLERAMKSGVGSWTVELGGVYAGVKVSALAAVNAVGDVRDPATRKIIAGARIARNSMEFADSARAMKNGVQSGFSRANTTLVVVATNARLNKVEATKLSQLAQLGVARSIDPVNTMSDGDVTIALSIGNMGAPVDALGVAAAEATAEAILRAVREARTLGGVPGLKQ